MKLPRTEMKKARIEIIPMIDAIFFLLVFFMMTSLSLTQLNSEKVKLPQSTALEVKPEGPKVVVTATKDGKFYLDQRGIQLPQLVPLLSQKITTDPRVTVVRVRSTKTDIYPDARIGCEIERARRPL